MTSIVGAGVVAVAIIDGVAVVTAANVVEIVVVVVAEERVFTI